MEKVVIVGAGPSGLLFAHYLLNRGDRYQVEIYDRLGDPREVALSNSRTIAYTLNERGMRALRPIDGPRKSCEISMRGTFHDCFPQSEWQHSVVIPSTTFVEYKPH